MKTKHTPAPWYPLDFSGGINIQNGPYYEDENILDYSDQDSGGSITEETATANAKLICAAPELLEACLEFVRKCDNGEARSVRSYNQMKEAIKKAIE